jgi:hypothetical protein
VREVIYAAVTSISQPPVYRELLAVLAEGMPQAAVELETVLGEGMRSARSRNWEPADVVRQVERQLGAGHAGYVGARRSELTTIEALARGDEVLALLLVLPPLPSLGLGQRRPRARSGDPRILEKVRALLAKAESTTFPEEAEALSAKAQELMARHAIDEAMVAHGTDDAPSGIRVPIDDPYAAPKSVLLHVVASANRCRAVWSKHLGFSTVLGFEPDLEFVDVLYTSLLVQATSAMVAAGSQVDRYGRSRTRSFRQSFLLAYAHRIGDRLRAAEAAGRAEAADEYGEALLPVLADRSAAVEAAFEEAFPDAVNRALDVSNAAGWAAGRAAADLASLSGRTEVPTHR